MKPHLVWTTRVLPSLLVLAGALGACGTNKTEPGDQSPAHAGDNDRDGDDSLPAGPEKADAAPPSRSGSPATGSGRPPVTSTAVDGGSKPIDAGNTIVTAADGGTAGDRPATGGAVACNPADKKPEPKPASFKTIKGYEKLSKEPTTGPFKPVLEEDPGLPKWTVYRPETLSEEAPSSLLIWANGGCLQNGTLYGQWLLEVASHGFVVVADGAPQAAGADPAAGGIRTNGDGKPQRMALDWIVAENERPCSQYYHKLDVTKVAVAGQSCGGIMSLGAAGDKRVTTAIIFNSGLFSADQAIYSALHAPMAYFIGGESDVAHGNAEKDIAAINTVPIFYGNLDVGHGATWEQTNAGEFGRVGLGWLKWRLSGDSAAEKMFSGADCELCKSPSKWVVKKKMMD